MSKLQPQSMIIKDNNNVFSPSLICSIRIAIITIFFVNGGLDISAQKSDKPASVAGTVEGEISRRQTQILEAEKLISDGDTLAETGNFQDAISKFIQAYNGINPSPISDDTRDLARRKFANAAVLRSKELIDLAEFVSAEELLDQVLQPSIDPKNKTALLLKERLQDPEWYNQARTPEHLENVKKVRRLLKLASGADQLGDFDKSMKYYTDVLRIDKTNTAA
ncbi:MAG: hypothetical protein CMP45_07040, partial [Rickettsiales bacterium]|nr:hypothetical protein [Rickettsiales bacterium]